MTYCSIEEAWGTSFSTGNTSTGQPDQTDHQPYGNIVPDNAINPDKHYSSSKFKRDQIYHKSGDPVFTKPSRKKRSRQRSFSRNMNRLPEHSGSKNRYGENGEKVKRLSFTQNNEKVLAEDDLPGYQNLDIPITGYDKELESANLAESSISYQTIKDKRPDSPFVSPMEEEGGDNYVPNVIEEESIYPSEDEGNLPGGSEDSDEEGDNSWEETVESYSGDSNPLKVMSEFSSLRENTVDVSLYVITGIFLIFILDTFVKLGKKRN